MNDIKEIEGSENYLVTIGRNMSEARKQILAKYGHNRMVRAFFAEWEGLANNTSGEKMNFPEPNQLSKKALSMWRDTLKDGRERSLIGFESGGIFYWSDVEVGDNMSAIHHKLSVGKKVVMKNPPQLFDIYDNLDVKLDNGKIAKITHDIHTHTANGPSFFSQAELPGFERSNFAKQGGVFGVIGCFGAYMAKAGKSETTTRLYALNSNGSFKFSLEDEAWNMLTDYFDDSFGYLERKMFFKELPKG